MFIIPYTYLLVEFICGSVISAVVDITWSLSTLLLVVIEVALPFSMTTFPASLESSLAFFTASENTRKKTWQYISRWPRSVLWRYQIFSIYNNHTNIEIPVCFSINNHLRAVKWLVNTLQLAKNSRIKTRKSEGHHLVRFILLRNISYPSGKSPHKKGHSNKLIYSLNKVLTSITTKKS